MGRPRSCSRVLSCRSRNAGTPGKRLVQGLDDVPPLDLDCLVALRRKVLEGLRVVECLCLIKAVPLGDAHTLGSRPLQCNNPSASRAEIASTSAGRLLRSLDKRCVLLLGGGIEHFGLGDSVGFGLAWACRPCTAAAPNAAPTTTASTILNFGFMAQSSLSVE